MGTTLKESMGTTLKEKTAQLTPERRARIEAEADRLQAEYQTLEELQGEGPDAQLAESLGIRQAMIAQLEKRSDLMISILRSYVEAIGTSGYGRASGQGAGLSRRLRRYRRAASAPPRAGAPGGHSG
jgi:hypothetical protein